MSSADEELCVAAAGGDVAEIERQIAAGADPNAFEGSRSYTPLRWAAFGGQEAAVAVLLKAGARVDGTDSDGTTPLMSAAGCGRTAAVEALVAADADVNRGDTKGDTALHWASMKGSLDAARVLLEAGAQADVRNKRGQPPIDVVRAPIARSWWLCADVTPLRRRMSSRRLSYP
jgi:uncharacterized protein